MCKCQGTCICNCKWEIHYKDVTSLYPYVMKYKGFPVGHPIVITERFDEYLNEYEKFFGLIECTVLAPKNIYVPALPVRDSKLLFPLCLTCVREKDKNCNHKCNHNDDKRAFTGTWVSEELYNAVENFGYKIIKYHEVWHYKERLQYDPITKSGGLFTDYINLGLKIKQESSGFPNHVKTQEEKEKYVQDYYDREGVRLDLDKIVYNPGRRAIAKLILNSLWGYLGLNNNKPITEFMTNESRWFELLTNDIYKIHNARIINNQLLVNYSFTKNSEDESSRQNVVLAAFVTAYGRTFLLNEMAKLGQRLIYCDTDSIIYLSRKFDYGPKTDIYLGDWTNELPKDTFIKHFISLGPKFYSYILSDGQIKTTCKGISQNIKTDSVLNFDSIKNLVINKTDSENYFVEQHQFKRDKNYKIYTRLFEKKFSFTFDKRVILKNNNNLPLGYSLD